MALPGVSDGGAHTKFVTTARYATEMLGYWVREHEIMSLEEAHWRLSALPRHGGGPQGRGASSPKAYRRDLIVYDLHGGQPGPQERCWTIRLANGG